MGGRQANGAPGVTGLAAIVEQASVVLPLVGNLGPRLGVEGSDASANAQSSLSFPETKVSKRQFFYIIHLGIHSDADLTL